MVTMLRAKTSVFKHPLGLLRAVVVRLLWALASAIPVVGRLTRHRLQILDIQRVTGAMGSPSLPWFPAESATRVPNYGQGAGGEEEDYPPIGFRTLESVLVTTNRRFTAVIKDGRLLLQHSVDPGPWQVALKPTVAGILRSEGTKALAQTRLGPRVEKGILVGTTSPHNWYSWLWDILPSCFLASKLDRSFDDWPLLLPESALVSRQWLEPLELIIGSRRTISLSPRQYSQVDKLVWIDSPNCPGPLPVQPHSTARFRIHHTAYRAFRAFVLEKYGLDPSAPSAPGKKTFIARGSRAHRPYNQDQLIEVAQRHGYSAVFFEELSFEQTVRTMYESSHVVGAHGAGWTSAAFCRPGTRGLMWTWPASRPDNWYANVATVPGIDFRVIETPGTSSNPFELAPETLSFELERLA